MERDFIRIRINDYAAYINLSALHTLPRSNFRRIIRMLEDPENQTPEDLCALGEYLREEILRRQVKWEEASRTYVNEWRLVPKSERRKKKYREILAYNRELISDVKRAKALHDKYQNLAAVFTEMTTDKMKGRSS